MFNKMMGIKSVQSLILEAEENKHDLKRTLGPFNLTTLGIGAVIGAGIFVLTGQVAAQYTGPAIVYSFILSAIVCVFAGLCYAEFASIIPVAGSAYTYAYATMGELFAWVIGWDLVLEYLFGATTVSVGWSGYVVSFLKDFGVIVPAILSSAPLVHDPVTGWHLTGAILNFPAMLVVLVMSILLFFGIKESANMNTAIVILKVVVILMFIVFGMSYIKPENWVPFIPENTGTFGSFGWSGILRGAGVIFYAYIGFDAVSTAAQEAKNPQRDMPIGILMSLAICTIIYILVALVLTGIVKYDLLLVPDPIAVGVDATGSALLWLRPFIKFGAIAGLSSVILVLLLGQSRIFYSMAKDGLLPAGFSKIHPKYKTPHIATLSSCLVGMVIAGLFPISVLGELVSIGTLLAFAIVSFGVLILRYTQPDLHRPFKTPLVPLVPILGVLSSVAQMMFLPSSTWWRLGIWMLIGFAVYFFYGMKRSKLR